MKDKWINEIRERMENYSPEVPDGLMEEVQLEMRKRGLSTVPVARHRRMLIGYRTASAAASVALLLGTAYYVGFPDEDEHLAQQMEQVARQIENDRTEVMSVQHEEPLLAVNTDTREEKIQKISSLPQKRHEVASDSLSTTVVSSKKENVVSTGQTDLVPESAVPDSSSDPSRSDRSYVEKNGIEKADCPSPSSFVGKRKKGISAGAYYSGGMIQQSQSGRGLKLSSANPYGNFLHEMSGDRVNGLLADTQDHEMKVHHDQPIKMGLSIHIPLSNRWGLQTGLTYSFLSSEVTQLWDRSSTVAKRKMHFIGIPLKVSYQIWQHKDWKVYAAAGGEVERMVSGKEEDKQFTGDDVRSVTSRKLKESKLQFSASAMAGVEYQWNQTMGVFAEAGGAYYFDNGSVIETIYSEKPFNVNLSFGFRFHFK